MQALESIPSWRTLIILTVVGLVATIGIRFLFDPLEAIMQESGGYGIIDYELAFTAEKADAMLQAWGETGRDATWRSLLIDFAFMPSYALLFGGITLLIARAMSGSLAVIGRWLAVGQWAAALLDALENVMLLIVLGAPGNVPALPPLVAGVSASIKFGLIGLAILYWAAAGIRRLTRRGDS